MAQQIEKWIARHFKVILTSQAIEWKLTPFANIYGDVINDLYGRNFNCRSIWVDSKNRQYRVKELYTIDMAQQTAVEWLFIQLYEKFEMKGDGMEMDKVFEHAKKMEEDINRKSFEAGNKRGWSGYPNTDNWTQPTFEQYYTQTYKNLWNRQQ